MFKKFIDNKEQNETTINITEDHLQKIQKYLFMLDLIAYCKECYETGQSTKRVIFTQPGMRYALAKALVYSLMEDEYFNACSKRDKSYIIQKILSDVKGRMLEDIVLLETNKVSTRDKEVFKFKFDDGGEYDMVVYDQETNTCQLYEVKHSEKIVEQQSRYFRDEERLKLMHYRFGEISGKYVIYRGKTMEVNGIQYLNVEEYLNSLGATR